MIGFDEIVSPVLSSEKDPLLGDLIRDEEELVF